MKLDKPVSIHIDAKIDMSDRGGFTTPASDIVQACKALDKTDYLSFDGFYCYPVSTLTAILGTYRKDSLVHVHSVTGWELQRYWMLGSVEVEEDRRGKVDKNAVLHERYIPHYNVLSLQENSEPSKQRVYSVRVDSLTSHVATLTTEAVTETQRDSWIAKAISKDGARPALMVHGGNFAADGFRLHYNAELPALPYEELRERIIKDILTPARKYSNQITLNAAAARELITACKLAKKGKRIFRMSVNGTLDITTTSEEEGNYHLAISNGYQHTGSDVTLAINPQYLMEAIDRPAAITMRIKDGKSPVYITDGQREAVIMTMQLG